MIAYNQQLTDTVTLQFRLATNGVIVNTMANGEPIVTTSTGLFGANNE